jgi:hypothetical protein
MNVGSETGYLVCSFISGLISSFCHDVNEIILLGLLDP